MLSGQDDKKIGKELIVSFDDLHAGNDRWEVFEELAKEFPDFKVTFFVITGPCSDLYLDNLKRPWNQLVFHSYEHSGHWLDWSVEDTKEWLLKFQKFGFEQGFKAPAYKWRAPHIQACNELDYWICTSPTVPVLAKRYWYTHPNEGLFFYQDKVYDEYYDHIQDPKFDANIEELKKYIRERKPVFKFISEKVVSHPFTQEDETRNTARYWK